MMEPIRIMMADDSPEIRNYFAGFLSHEADMELVGSASSGAEAVQMAGELRPDIILMDIQMETRVAGIAASKQILAKYPAIKIIILTILEDDDLLFQAYCAGVIDYINETFRPGDVVFSLMSQYTPVTAVPEVMAHPKLSRRISAAEHKKAVEYLSACENIAYCFCQERSSSGESFIPDFDSGILIEGF